MSATSSVKALLALTNTKQSDLMDCLGMASKQSLSNKFTKGRWSADDLVEVAERCGGKLVFLLPDGQQITISKDEKAPE